MFFSFLFSSFFHIKSSFQYWCAFTGKLLAPEILIGLRSGRFIEYDHCVDWFSLGVVACRMLTNQVWKFKFLQCYWFFICFSNLRILALLEWLKSQGHLCPLGALWGPNLMNEDNDMQKFGLNLFLFPPFISK